jgi:mannose-6-phosphate isomerase-like protein (cupin superfamily)
MVQSTITVERKSLNKPDEARKFANGGLEVVHFGAAAVGRLTLRPGWRWSRDVRPIAKTESCQMSHFQYVVSGRLTVQMDDGSETEIRAGDVVKIPPGHDAWVVGDDACVLVDFTGMGMYAQPEDEWPEPQAETEPDTSVEF